MRKEILVATCPHCDALEMAILASSTDSYAGAQFRARVKRRGCRKHLLVDLKGLRVRHSFSCPAAKEERERKERETRQAYSQYNRQRIEAQ